MKERLVNYLVCPSCQGDLELSTEEMNGIEVTTGSLKCNSCAVAYPIVRGVPRFANLGEIGVEKAAIASSFGFEWQHFVQNDDRYAEQMLGWIDPVRPEFFKNKIVLDGGCGKGRHMELAGEWGARDVIGIDISDAVETAFGKTEGKENMHIIQADLCRLPLKRVVDYAYSVGVIDHLPEPFVGFKSIASKIREGGHLSVWVYGAENNWWIEHLISPVRRRFTSRINPTVLLHLSKLPTAAVYVSTKLVYGPLNRSQRGKAIAERLFYNDYMKVIAEFGWVEQHNIVFDHLVSPMASYLTREEFTKWWAEIDAKDVTIGWHNKNSWRGTGQID
jgi:SAM-dependent methyltransferase/uncharacterized protein YbaR (Trm112 family)